MTPQELFNIIIFQQSRYIVAQCINTIVKANDPVMLKLFIEEMEELGEKWISRESDRLNNERWQEYEGEVERVNNIYIAFSMSEEDYKSSLPISPMPVVASLPPLFFLAIEELKKRMTEPIIDLVNYTSTGATPATGGTAPEGVRLPSEVDNPQAQGYFTELINFGFMEIVDGRYEWRGTRKELALCAELISEKLGFEGRKWKIFQDLFGMKNLAQEKYKAVEDGKFSKRDKKLREIFKI